MIIDLETLFPEGLSDETISAIAELLNNIAEQWDSHYFPRIRSHQERHQIDLFDPEQPWQRKAQE